MGTNAARKSGGEPVGRTQIGEGDGHLGVDRALDGVANGDIATLDHARGRAAVRSKSHYGKGDCRVWAAQAAHVSVSSSFRYRRQHAGATRHSHRGIARHPTLTRADVGDHDQLRGMPEAGATTHPTHVQLSLRAEVDGSRECLVVGCAEREEGGQQCRCEREVGERSDVCQYCSSGFEVLPLMVGTSPTRTLEILVTVS